MDNKDIARIFAEITDIMELQNENAFRVRAYQNAARVIENLSEPLQSLHEKQALETIDGIGKGIAEKIAELLETGSMAYYEELKSSIPPGLLDMIKVPNLGPKKAKLIYNHLQVASIEELKKAAEEGKLQFLPGMGKKSESKILKGIATLEQSTGRHTLGIAQPIALEILDRIKKITEVQRAEAAGSLRRGQETVGDVDILVSTQKPTEVMEEFLSTPGIDEILAKGQTKSSIVLKNKLQIDLRVVPEKSFGAALQYFTGSKAHNVKLRETAVKQKLKINEYGVFETGTDKKVAGETEESVYKSIELVWIPPELREGLDEIELARHNTLPRLIERSDIISALHNHTTASDGWMSLDELVKQAQKRGYKFIAVTDHSGSLGVANGLSPDRLKRQMDEIHEYNEKNKHFRVLTGTEVDIKANGSLDFPDDLLEQLDIVIAAIHSSFAQPLDKMMKRICNALENPHVDMISHPTGRLIGKRDALNIDKDELFSLAASTKTVLEINSYYLRLDLNDQHIREAKEYGVNFSIETDTHHIEDFDQLEFGIKTARRGRLSPNDVLNTLEIDDLMKRLNKQ